MTTLLVRHAPLPGGPRGAGYVAARTALLDDALTAAGLRLDDATLVRRCAVCGSGDHGKPEVAAALAAGWHVSVAHTPTWLVVAVADAPCGVDVEGVAAVERAPVAPVLLAPSERTRDEGFSAAGLARTWVRKEALLKATGHGLAVDPHRLVLGPPDEPPRVLSWDGPGPRPRPTAWSEGTLPQDARVLVTAVALHVP